MLACIATKIAENLFRRNLLMHGQFLVGNHAVDLRKITCSVLNIIGEHDDVVHPTSSLPLVDLVGSQDARTLLFPTGHIGAAVSTAAQQKLWPQVSAWLTERDAQWLH
jgi:polyhydroxyalkanoate synthase